MFETVAPEVSGSRRAYESLPVSVAAHVIAVAAFIVVPQWRLVFPDQPPQLVRSYSLEQVPEPPPPPAAPRAATTAAASNAAPAASTAPPVNLDLAPVIIPDAIPVVPVRAAALTLSSVIPVAAPSVADEGRAGAGDGGGTAEAAPPKTDALMGGVMVGDRVEFSRNSNLPLFVERKRYPQYPEDERNRHLEDDVTLRYVIGKDGVVKEIIVLEHPKWRRFEESAVAAIRTWKFRPFSVNGEVHEVVHELVVSFRLE